ncbi:AzlC family ABC transporter permease [Salarchaeum sp. III]|uniref:AzlC family ABC transporter permease n=1 Tax=Salarchaeum sp. III TaxID=3107927 RepID=UPI002EDA9E5E
MADADATAEPTPTSDAQRQQSLSFSLAGVREGFVAGLPVAVGVAGYGVVFGVLAARAGLSVAEAALMSATVLAGAAQLLAVELWRDPVPVAAVLTTTAVVNLRYVLMGAALRPWFRDLSPVEAYGSAFFTADENWALTVAELRDGSTRGAFLLGSGLAIWVLWVAATVVGATAGDLVGDPARWGLDFVVTAVFLTLAAGLWEGEASLRPWLAAAGVAIAASAVLPGKWYVVGGALAGALVEVVTHDA